MVNLDYIRGQIKSKYKTEANFSKIINTNPGNLSLILNGKSKMSFKMAEKIIKALDIPREEIGLIFFT